MQRKVVKNTILEKAILKSILPYVGNGEDWASNILYLGRVNFVAFENKPEKKEKKPKCMLCGTPYDNYLLYVLHIELIHKVEYFLVRTRFWWRNTSFPKM